MPTHKRPLQILQERPLSPDQFKTFSRCNKKYWLQYIQRLNWPSDQRNFELGKNVHKLMEYQARGLPLETLINASPVELQAIWHKLCEHPASQWPIVASEWGFSIPLFLTDDSFPSPLGGEGGRRPDEGFNKYWISGRIDRIAWDPDTQTLWVLDWKTGTAAPKNAEADWQTRIYLWAVLKAYPQLRAELSGAELQAQLPIALDPRQLRFMYLEVSVKDPSAPIKEIVVTFDESKAAQYAEVISHQLERLVHQAGSGHFPLPAKCPDIYCQYNPICGIREQTGELGV